MPKKYVEKVGDEGFKKAPVGAGPLQVRLVHARASSWCWRPSSSTGARRPSVKRLVFRVDPRRVHAAGRAQARRGGHRLLDPRRAGRGAAAHAGPHAQARGHPGPVLALLRRPVGPEVAVARPARAAGREPRHRPAGHQPGADARPLAGSPAASSRSTFEYFWQPPAYRLRPGPGQAAPGRGRLSQRLRRGRVLLRHVLREHRRAGRQLPAGRWASAPGSARWSARPSSRGTGRRSSRTSSRAPAGPSATPPPGSRPSWPPAAPTPTAAIPDIDGLFREQAAELDRKRREATLHTHPAARPREGDVRPDLGAGLPERRRARACGSPASGLIAGHAYSAPYEDLKLKGK